MAVHPSTIQLPPGKQVPLRAISVIINTVKPRGAPKCCGSGMFIPDPDPTIFWYPGSRSERLLSRIPDPDSGSGSYK
jgi:hypothetical protein